MMNVYARSGRGNAGYTEAAARQLANQTGMSVTDARAQVRGNIRGTTGAGSGRPASRANFVRGL